MATIVTRAGKGSPLTNTEVDANFTNLNTDKAELSGAAFTGNITFTDNSKAIFGAGSDLQIYHDGSNSYIQDQGLSGTGNLILAGADVEIATFSGNKYFLGSSNVARLYHTNNEKLATTSTGINVTGNISLPDNGKATFGAGDDLQIYHDGSDSVIAETGTGNLALWGNNIKLLNAGGTETMLDADPNGAVTLYYNDVTRLATSGAGIEVTGTATMDGLTVDVPATQDIIFQRAGGVSGKLELDFSAQFTNFNSVVDGFKFYQNGTQVMQIRSGDISFYEDTGTTAKLFWDASAESLGIGTSSPTRPLTVNGNNGTGMIINDAANDKALRFRATGDAFYIEATNNAESAYANLALAGNVGIGTSSPSEALHVSGGGLLIDSNIPDAPASGTSGFIADYVPSLKATRFWSRGDATTRGSFEFKILENDGGSQVDAMVIDSSGNVGIGVSDPQAKLHLSGNSDVVPALKIGTATFGHRFYDSGATGDLVYKRETSGTEYEVLRFNRGNGNATFSGNVGIGTSSPTDLLNISGSSNQIGLDTGDQATYGTLDIGHFINGAFIGTQAGSNAASNILRLGTSGSERMRIDSAGNLLVGTTSTDRTASTGITLNPAGFIDISRSGTIAGRFSRLGSDGSVIDFRKDGTAVGSIGTSSADGFYIHSTFGNDSGLVFGSERIVPCTSTGAFDDAAVDLGYSSGRFKDLYLSGTAAMGGLTVSNASGGSVAAFTNTSSADLSINLTSGVSLITPSTGILAFGTSSTERMRIDSAGNLLVGTTSQTAQLTVNNGGNNYPSWLQNSSSSVDYPNRVISSYATGGQTATMFLFLAANGDMVGSVKSTVTATTYNTSSDQRLKENIADADDAGSKIDAIQVRQYDWKVDGSHQDYGMVAQELQAVAPEAVSGDADSEDMMGVDYSKLVPMLIKEIQSLRNRVAQLEE